MWHTFGAKTPVLEKVSNIAVILAACAVAATAVYDRAARPGPPGASLPGGTFTQQYKGKSIPLEGFQPGAATVVLFVSKDCRFCAASAPFYQRLAAMRSASSGRLRIVASVPRATETEEEARAYFSARGIALDWARPAPFRLIGVSSTPTLALVSSKGIVTDVWIGKLVSAKEAEVIRRISAECNGCIRESGGGGQR